jgi:Tfp pilus assembly protein PilW
MASKPTVTDRSRAAFTLVEVVVAMGVSSLVLAAILSFYLYSNRSFVFLTNHVFMEQQNQFAMDYLSRQIRQVRRLTGCSATSLTFADYDGNSLQLVYDPSRQVLSRIKQGQTNALVTSCASLQFRIYGDNLQSNTFDVISTATNVAQCKVVGVAWTCSKSGHGVVNSEPLQCAKILIRNANGQ